MEHALISPVRVGGFPNFRLRSLGVHDAILSRNLLAIPTLVARLFLPVFLQLLLEAGLELVDLRVLDLVVFALHCVLLQRFDLVFDRGVEDLGLRDDGFELLVRGRAIGGGEGALVCGGYAADLRCESADVGLDCFHSREEVLVGHDGALGPDVLDSLLAGLLWWVCGVHLARRLLAVI